MVSQDGPGERDQGEGQDTEGRPVEESEEGAEHQAHLPPPHGHRVAGVDGRDWLHQEGGEEVGEAKVDEQQMNCRILHLLVMSYCGHHQQVQQNPQEGQTHLG